MRTRSTPSRWEGASSRVARATVAQAAMSAATAIQTRAGAGELGRQQQDEERRRPGVEAEAPAPRGQGEDRRAPGVGQAQRLVTAQVQVVEQHEHGRAEIARGEQRGRRLGAGGPERAAIDDDVRDDRQRDAEDQQRQADAARVAHPEADEADRGGGR